ncbi:MAG TPA: molybdopterin-synthase adenylyltransferase MoeB [Gemmatimonadales bacterium]|nr:molybdopterin-synthase adenylyltransferase MoeB [Gemmatimonadales bacterium]
MTLLESSPADLTPDDLHRYARHLSLPDVGIEGQRRLKAARILLVGAGGLGSPAALYLAAAGVGTLGLVDFDRVDTTNLQRQVLYGTGDVGRPKLEAAAARLRDLNPGVRVAMHPLRLDSTNALDVLRGYDLVLDGSDNFPTRYLVNDACVLLGLPYVYGSIFRFEGQVSLFDARRGPCYRCLFADPPPRELVPSCAEGGVLGVLPGIIGALQALEAIKWVLGRGDTLVGRLLLFDALRMSFRELALQKDPACPVCGEAPTIRALIDYEAFCGMHEPAAPAGDEISVAELRAALRGEGPRPVVLDVREPHEWEIARIPGARLIPLGELPGRLDELERGVEIVAHCHHGARSLRAVRLLREAGFERVRSLAGGIDAWAVEVDPTVRRY